MSITVSAFYKFATIDDPVQLRDQLRHELVARAMKGTILVAPEGINGTISGAPEAMTEFLSVLRSDERFVDLVTKDAMADQHPFMRLKVKVKREIITLGQPAANPLERTGTRVDPRDWNALIADPDVLVIDTRNAYEVEVGTFAGAIDPKIGHFTHWPAYVVANLDAGQHRKVAMFCTGGIRCEKASAYLLAHGFNEVYQLEGGILNYLAKVSAEESKWHGECFVFDERGAVGQKYLVSPSS